MAKDTQDRERPTPAKRPAHEPTDLDQHVAMGHELIPLNRWDHRDAEGRERGKSPRDAGWRTADYRRFDPAAHMAQGMNVGVRLGPEDLVVDVDPRHFADGDDPLARLAADCGLSPAACPTVVTGSGGLHLYLRKPADLDALGSLADYPGLEFKAAGAQAVAAGSLHPQTGRPYAWQDFTADVAPRAPLELLRMLRRPERPAGGAAPGAYTPEQLAACLSKLDPCDYADNARWLRIAMACHFATAGAGRQEFLDWCSGDGRYRGREKDNARRWDSFSARGTDGAVTHLTLESDLRDRGPDAAATIPRATALEDFGGAPADLPPELAAARPAPGGDVPISQAWVYVADAHAFVRRSDRKKLAPEQWKALHAFACEGDVLNAVWKNRLPVRKCESIAYVPCAPEFPTPTTYNTWRPSGAEAMEGDVGPFIEHAEYLLPDERERDMLLDFLAVLVQRPAEKVMFACLLRGVQGTGKSWVGELMARVVGEPNVARPSNDDVVGAYTGWMEGAQLALIEELMTLGRLEVANRLKPLITQPTLRVNEKYLRAYSIPNHLNLLCFTNHENALRVENGDRRWMVLFSPARPRGRAYYRGLFAFLDGGGASAVKHWLLARAVRLDPKGRAPETRGKEEMRLASMEDLESHLLSLLEERRFPFEFDLARFDDVVAVLPSSARSKGTRARVTKFLKEEAGAVCQGRYTKGDRPAHTLWSIRDHERWDEVGAAGRIDAFLGYLEGRREADER